MDSSGTTSSGTLGQVRRARMSGFFRTTPFECSNAASLEDLANKGWRLGAVLEDGWTWKMARESILEERERKDPQIVYGLSEKAAKILRWIWNLHDHEMELGMTPCVETAASEQIGIERLDYDPNTGSIIELLIEARVSLPRWGWLERVRRSRIVRSRLPEVSGIPRGNDRALTCSCRPLRPVCPGQRRPCPRQSPPPSGRPPTPGPRWCRTSPPRAP